MLHPMIVFSSVTKEFHGRRVVDNVSFDVAPGEFVCLTGPSGAGKSTIVHLLIRAEFPTAGIITVDGADLAHLPRPILQMYRRNMGVLFQDYKLLSDRTVEENIAFALEVADVSDTEIAPRVEELLKRLHLSGRRHAFPSELSGGEKTRTALARAIAGRPSILIADEPTGNIDPDQSMEILEILKEINREGATVILASHDQRVIDSLHVRVLRLENGKLVRDSVGGYRHNAASSVPQAVVGVEEVSVRIETHAAPKKQHEQKMHMSGKIKPIAI